MAKLSSINKNNKRIKLSNKFFKKRQTLKKIIMNKNLNLDDGNTTFLWFLTCAFFNLAIISPIGSLKLIFSFLPAWFNHSGNFTF